MTDEQLREFNKNRKIFQIGIVVADIDQAIEQWETIYRVGPWNRMHFTQDCVTNPIMTPDAVKEGFHYNAATAIVGDLQVELIEANESVPIFQKFLNETGGGLHHIKEQISDDKLPAALEDYASREMPVAYGGHYYNANFFFMDTVEKLGVQIELGNCVKLIKPEE
jgi:hypothetical protein